MEIRETSQEKEQWINFNLSMFEISFLKRSLVFCAFYDLYVPLSVYPLLSISHIILSLLCSLITYQHPNVSKSKLIE